MTNQEKREDFIVFLIDKAGIQWKNIIKEFILLTFTFQITELSGFEEKLLIQKIDKTLK